MLQLDIFKASKLRGKTFLSLYCRPIEIKLEDSVSYKHALVRKMGS